MATDPDPAAPGDPDAQNGQQAPQRPGPEQDAKPAPDQNGSERRRANEELKQQMSVTNNFYAEVSAHQIGFSADSASFGKSSIDRDSGVLARDDADHALRHYLEPVPFGKARQILADRRLVALIGPEGCGKRAGTLRLARLACPDADKYTVLPPTRSLLELSRYPYQPGEMYLLYDWVPVSGELKSVASYNLEQLVTKLAKTDAYLAVTFEAVGPLQVLLGEVCVQWSAPDPVALLDHCVARLEDLRLEAGHQERLRDRARQLRSPRLIVTLAETAVKDIEAALDQASERESAAVADWFDAKPERWKVHAAVALTFLSGVTERKFERLLAELTEISDRDQAGGSDDDHGDALKDDDPHVQSRWRLAKDAGLESFVVERDPQAPVGAEHRPAFRTKADRLRFMMELNRRYGDELWAPVCAWLFELADQPFGEAQIAAGYGLALLSRCALGEVEATYLRLWSAGDLEHRLVAVSVLRAMAQDDQVAAAALKIVVTWVRDAGPERAITAALAFGGPLGQRYPSEAMRWLWVLSRRAERISRFARMAMSQLFFAEADADVSKSAVPRFLLRRVRSLLEPGASARERRAALSLVNSVLGATQATSTVPVVATLVRIRPADLPPLGELWAAVLNSSRHRLVAIVNLHRTLLALVDDANSVTLAAQLGEVILPRLTPRSFDVLERVLPDPERTSERPARVVAAFLGAQHHAIGAIQ